MQSWILLPVRYLHRQEDGFYLHKQEDNAFSCLRKQKTRMFGEYN
jgi:hypothetical protein